MTAFGQVTLRGQWPWLLVVVPLENHLGARRLQLRARLNLSGLVLIALKH
jgi:hypothetical protein